MKSVIFSAILLATLSISSYGQLQAVSRFGAVSVVEGENQHRLLFKGTTILENDGDIQILSVLNGNGRDYAIVVNYSGGIACPAQAVVVELEQSGYKMTKEFGSCSDAIKARLVNSRVIVEMPMYAPHPELLSRAELRKRRTMKEVYTLYQGRLSKSIRPL